VAMPLRIVSGKRRPQRRKSAPSQRDAAKMTGGVGRSGAQRYCSSPHASSPPVIFAAHRGHRDFFSSLLNGGAI
jgi:hypothetical protein